MWMTPVCDFSAFGLGWLAVALALRDLRRGKFYSIIHDIMSTCEEKEIAMMELML
jgi:hypothetical protein